MPLTSFFRLLSHIQWVLKWWTVWDSLIFFSSFMCKKLTKKPCVKLATNNRKYFTVWMNTVLSNKKIIEILTSQRDKSEGFKYKKKSLCARKLPLCWSCQIHFNLVLLYINSWVIPSEITVGLLLTHLRFIEKCHTPMTCVLVEKGTQTACFYLRGGIQTE